MNEVSDTCWVSKAELEEMFAKEGEGGARAAVALPALVTAGLKANTIAGNSFTPWFKLIAESFLYKWWDDLLARSVAEDNPATTAGVRADASVLRELVTDKDRNEIHRMVKDTVKVTVQEDAGAKEAMRSS